MDYPRHLSTEQMRDMMIHVATRIIENVDVLTQADRQIGDGDHGLGMSRGFESVKDELCTGEFPSVTALLKSVGDTLIDRMGGASGIVFGLMFRGGARGADAGGQMNLGDFAAYLDRSIAEIMARGGAKPGDKTMLDALRPAVTALQRQAASDSTFQATLAAAAEAAAEGRDATRNFVARFGKSATMGERSLGHADAGAVSVAIIFAAMSEWAAANLPARSPDRENHHAQIQEG